MAKDIDISKRADLRQYLQILKRRKAIASLTLIVALGLGASYTVLKSPTYTATATVLVPQQQASAALNVSNAQLQPSDALQRFLADQQQFAQGDAVKREVRQAIGSTGSISIGTSTTADVLTFTATSGVKAGAAKAANAYAAAYIKASRTSQVDQYTQQVTALQESISRLQAKAAPLPPTDPQLPALQQSISTLTQTVEQTQAASQISSQVGPTVISHAQAPQSPSSPKLSRDIGLAAFAGIIFGLGLVFLVERLDDRIHSRELAEQATGGAPVIALLPKVDSWQGRETHHLALSEDPTSHVAEAYRTFRTAVQFLGIDQPKRVIGITSSIAGEGKTTATANLALSFARAGQRIAIVSCDLRRPYLHRFFSLENKIGLTSVLLGDASLDDALLTADLDPNLLILPSGPIPPNPAEILSMDKVRRLIEDLAARVDLVLLDCPPVLPVTDTLLLTRLVDGVLVLASAKSTSTRELHRTFEMLNQVHAPVLGLVLNRVPLRSEISYEYGYGPSYGYSSAGPVPEKPPYHRFPVSDGMLNVSGSQLAGGRMNASSVAVPERSQVHEQGG